VATARGIEVRSGTVRAEGAFDFRGTLGVDRFQALVLPPQAAILAVGTLRDTVVYSIIASEWPTVKAHLDYQLNEKPR